MAARGCIEKMPTLSDLEFEEFVIERFLDFYNNENKFHFDVLERKDEKIRNKPAYDFHCLDGNTKKCLAIEMKRFVSQRINEEKRIEGFFNKYVMPYLRNKTKGSYLITVDMNTFRLDLIRDRARKIKLSDDLIAEIISNPEGNDLKRLLSCPEVALVSSKSETDHFILDLSSINKEGICRLLQESNEKFRNCNDFDKTNIVICLESSTATRKKQLRALIQNMKAGIEKRFDLSLIHEFYHLGLYRNPVIARIFPRPMSSIFFDPEEFMGKAEYRRRCGEYFRLFSSADSNPT